MDRSEMKKEAARLVLESVVDTVAEAGEFGAPGGVLYAALMSYGISLETFEKMMNVLVLSGRLKKEGHVYYVV